MPIVNRPPPPSKSRRRASRCATTRMIAPRPAGLRPPPTPRLARLERLHLDDERERVDGEHAVRRAAGERAEQRDPRAPEQPAHRAAAELGVPDAGARRGAAPRDRPRRPPSPSSSRCRWRRARDPGRADEAEDGAAPGNATDLNVLHACLHCRTAKTACTDQRPCNRCTRLGLDCVSYREEPRKRACTGCHSAKVSCDLGVLGGDTCTRCRRLGTPCIPRTTGSMRGCVRKRKRPADDGGGAGGYGLPLGEGTAAAAAAGLLLPMSHSPAPSPTPSNMVSVAVSSSASRRTRTAATAAARAPARTRSSPAPRRTPPRRCARRRRPRRRRTPRRASPRSPTPPPAATRAPRRRRCPTRRRRTRRCSPAPPPATWRRRTRSSRRGSRSSARRCSSSSAAVPGAGLPPLQSRPLRELGPPHTRPQHPLPALPALPPGIAPWTCEVRSAVPRCEWPYESD